MNPPTQGRERLSVLILARNEEGQIGTCLEQVAWADEVLVVDDMSDDRTAAISRHYGARIVQRAFDNFSDQANFGLKHLTGDWVLSLDADERVTEQLSGQIQQVLKEKSPHAGFTFKRLNFFLGHRMRYGGWYHDVLHLFRRGAGEFAGKVHHTPQLNGSVGQLDAWVEHRPFQNLSQFIQRQNRYTSMEAREWFQQFGASRRGEVKGQVTRKPLKLFWKMYLKKQGFREGFHGFLFSFLFAWVHMIKWVKYDELCQQSGQPSDADASLAASAVA